MFLLAPWGTGKMVWYSHPFKSFPVYYDPHSQRLQHYVNQEIPDVQAGFRKGRRTRDQIVHICWITEKAKEFQKNIYLCFINYTKAFDCVDHNKLESS